MVQFNIDYFGYQVAYNIAIFFQGKQISKLML